MHPAGKGKGGFFPEEEEEKATESKRK